MDPVSIAGVVSPTLKTLYTVTTTLYTFTTSAKKVDESLENLHGEVRGLTRVVEDIEAVLKDRVVAQTSYITFRTDGAWGPIAHAIQDTRRTIKALQKVLDRLGPPSKVTNGIKKTLKQVQLDFNSDEISTIKSRLQWHLVTLQLALQTAILAINCQTNDNVINVINPKIDTMLPLVSRVESLIKQVENLSSQLATKDNQLPNDFGNSDRTEYTRQLKRTAEAAIVTASTVIESQSTVVGAKYRQYQSSSSSGKTKHKIEEWITHLTVDHEELGPESDSISELMPDDSISCIGLNSNRRSQQINGTGMPGPSPRTRKSADILTSMDTRKNVSAKNISEERFTPLHLDEGSSISSQEDLKPGIASRKTVTEYRVDLNIDAFYDDAPAKKLLAALGISLDANEWNANDAFLELGKMSPGQGVRSSSNIKRILLYLLEMGADVNATDAEACTALHHVSWSGNTAVLDLLVEQNANVNMRNKDGLTALHLAAPWGHTSVVDLLLEHGVDVDPKIEKRHSPEFDEIPFDQTPLHLAAWNGHVGVVKALLKAGASVDARDDRKCTPLQLAAWRGRVEVAEVLLKAGASIDAGDYKGFTSLHRAAPSGYAEVAEALLKAGASVNPRTTWGDTPLHYAAAYGRVEVAEALLKAGASIDPKNDYGNTPLMCAACRGHRTIIELLLAAGADIRARNNVRDTVLHRVLFYKHTKNCEEVSCGFCSASEIKKDILKLLCENGADPSATSDDGHSALSWIRSDKDYPKSERQAIIKVLKREHVIHKRH